MSEKIQKSFLTLSITIAVLSLAASAGGLLLDGLYRDNAFVSAVWKGNDVITLALAVPVLAVSIWLARKGSLRAKLIWLGMLNFTLYNFAFYLFAAAFNWFFLLYTALFTLSIFALIFGLLGLDPQDIRDRFTDQTPRKWIAGYMIFVAFGLTLIEGMQIAGFIFTDQLPEIVLKVEHPTHVVPALDLSLLVPWLITGAIWLWKDRAWGYIITAVLLVKGVVYNLVLSAVSLSTQQAGLAEFPGELPVWGLLFVGFLVCALFFYKNLRPEEA